MFRKFSYVFLLSLLLIVFVIILVSIRSLVGKIPFFNQKNIQKVDLKISEPQSAEQVAVDGPGLPAAASSVANPSPNPVLNPSSGANVLGAVSRELVAKMTGDVGFDAAIVPAANKADGLEYKMLFVKESSERRVQSLEVLVPKGILFKFGSEVKDKEVIGLGKLNIYSGDNLEEILINVVNNQDVEGHVAHWMFYLGSIESPRGVIDGFVDGDATSGFKISFSRSLSPGGKPKGGFTLSVFSVGDGGSIVYSGSGEATDKGRVIIRYFDGSSVEIKN